MSKDVMHEMSDGRWRGTFVHRAEKAQLAGKIFGRPGLAEFFYRRRD